MSDTASAATEVVADMAEEVAEQATQLAQASRGLSSRDVSLVFGGFVVGAGLGGALGFIFGKRKLETKYSQLAAEEIAGMRQHYADKATALLSETSKPDPETIVRDRGYISEETTEPPMAVTPPDAVVVAAQEAAEEDASEDNTTDEEPAEPEVRNVFAGRAVVDEWDYHKEKARRSPLTPYVIHRDERDEHDAYESLTFTYYESDDVLCNETDEILSEELREKLIGESNLERFGHGSDDANLVYIRNDELETDFEVIRSPNSYAEEVHGFQHTYTTRRRERNTFDDE